MVNRVSGLASGMDTESMVKSLMDSEKTRLYGMQRQKQKISWKQDGYREINVALNKFKEAAGELRLQGPFLAKKVVSDNVNVVTAKATSNAKNGTFSMAVMQLAEKATITSDQLGNGTDKLKLTDKINTQGSAFDLDINGKTVRVTQDMTVGDFENAVNALSGETKVQVYFSELTGKLKFSSTNTGENLAKINIKASEDSEGVVDPLAQSFISSDLKMTQTSASGKSAHVNIDGRDMAFESNTFSHQGVDFTVKNLTAENQPIAITISADSEEIVDKIKKFVSAYNDLVAMVQEKTTEKSNRDYQPLLEHEKTEMSETQVTQWEKKSKAGLFRGDSMLQGVMSKMRTTMSGGISGASSDLNMLSEIGISTGKGFGAYAENGKLHIDEAKLKSAIESNPEAVMNIFAQSGEGGSEGIAKRLYDQANAAIAQITKKAGSATGLLSQSMLDKQMKTLDNQISAFNEKLSATEERYWKQFSAMEKMMASANSQSSYLYSMFQQ